MIKDIENQIETVNRNKDTKIKGISITIIMSINNENRDDKMNEKDNEKNLGK